MNPGTYRTTTGELVRVDRTPSGDHIIRYSDGRTVVIR